MSLRSELEKAEKRFLERYDSLDCWQWNDEQLIWTVQDYHSSLVFEGCKCDTL